MMGLAILFLAAAYLVISRIFVIETMGIARRAGGRPWLWGGIVGLIMYNLVFWDLIPTLIAHKYYCATEAGFWVYKTPEQWKQENPGVIETLDISHLPEQYRVDAPNKYDKDHYFLLPDGTRLIAHYDGAGNLGTVRVETPEYTDGYQLNERIRQLYRWKEPAVLSVKRYSGYLVDAKNNEVLAKYVDFRRGYASLSSGGSSLNDLKVWLVGEQCDASMHLVGKFRSFSNKLRGEVNK